MDFIFAPAIWQRYGPLYVQGFAITIALVIVSFILGGIFAIFIAQARISKSKILKKCARVYIFFFRGSPLLAQLYLFYYGIGSLSSFWQSIGVWWYFKSPFLCCVTIFALNSAAYQAEILRGSFQSVPRSQWEACKALSLERKTTFFRIILPQAMISALRPLSNEFIILIKSSAIVSLVAMFDIMGVTKLAFSRSYDFQVYLWAALLYLLLVEIVRRLVQYIEKRLTLHIVT
ncbi:ABC transporter permease [Bartonella tamiae]|uniref:His/Glu/Gln/Arg/opine family amino ABC transporter, permease, 3-TM region n=1 Tax=Bartonella tamiae Th239 TaxID=1094558 RepID=J0ZLM9_9HYPH|nr:ABC transporter permease subunit [Bartonella tamiae]EJF89323.1 His/Glu/Gln/Arg/opine family amino ABC transporter, permease, 3-TM region [Bartonella tamiae Th239]EJF95515.1 His/Glu/Gln/Arg/opine family amino ABC transporter, permease, 3-TM region [Bartonella tamiae Th307]